MYTEIIIRTWCECAKARVPGLHNKVAGRKCSPATSASIRPRREARSWTVRYRCGAGRVRRTVAFLSHHHRSGGEQEKLDLSVARLAQRTRQCQVPE